MELYAKYTTLLYRPPEMLDQYLGYTVDLKVDIWMLGCILYSLCFGRHPFQEAQTLGILNAHYLMPDDCPEIGEKLRDLIRLLLTPNPAKRPTIEELGAILGRFENSEGIQLSDDAMEIKRK